MVLKFGGFWNPFTSADKLYKRILYGIWKCYCICTTIFWEICLALLFVYESENTELLDMVFLVQVMLSTAKALVVNYNRKDIDWLVYQTEIPPFYCEYDEE